MKGCEKAVQVLASARVYCCGFQMIKKAYFDAVIALDGFPGTKEELEEFMEAMRCVEDMELRIQKAAKELAEGCGGSGAWEAEDDRIERQEERG